MILFSRRLALAAAATLCACTTNVLAVTVYGNTRTGSAAAPSPTLCIGAVACDGNVLQPPGPSSGSVNASIPVQLYSTPINGLSMTIPGHFAGFSIELSVADKLFGPDGNHLHPVFLNLMSAITSRVGQVYLRVGGNTQDKATILPNGLPDGKTIEKTAEDTSTTFTPRLLVSPNLLYAMGNISVLLPIKWFLGVPFNDTQNPRLLMGQLGERILGSNLLGLQLGNEPDLYFNNGLRGSNYSPQQYNTEWGQVVQNYISDSTLSNKSNFIAPSVCCGPGTGWTPEQVWDTGFLQSYANDLAYISVQHYPTNNCNSSGRTINPQDIFGSIYLNHSLTQSLNQLYVNTSNIAQSLRKPLVMFETNTASCGGFSGLSDSFAAALWTIDYSMNMALTNFSHALFHVGGQNAYYNAFTPPPGNQTRFRQWTVGSTFYPMLVLGEIFGRSELARVADLFLNNNDPLSPGYVIYENNAPARVLLMNFVTDASGASNYTAYISIGGNNTSTAAATPSSVRVKYLLAPSTAEKFAITWAGQTFGGPFAADGRLQGQEVVYTYACDTSNNVCAVPVPAPALALVFLSQDVQRNGEPATTQTFATSTTATGPMNTATVDQHVLATSNGRGGGHWEAWGSTSYGSSSNAEQRASSMVFTLGSAALTVTFSVIGELFADFLFAVE